MPTSRAYAVPRLDGIPTEYQFIGGIDGAARLALALISAGLADTAQWAQVRRDSFAFIAQALKDFVEAHGGEELGKGFFFRLGLVSDLDPYACDGKETGLQDEMYIILEPDSAGYVVLEPTLRLLSRTHPRLPITFFDLFTGALNRWVRVYDYREHKRSTPTARADDLRRDTKVNNQCFLRDSSGLPTPRGTTVTAPISKWAAIRTEWDSTLPTTPFGANVRIVDLYGQSLPDPLWRCGESLRSMHDHSAQ